MVLAGCFDPGQAPRPPEVIADGLDRPVTPTDTISVRFSAPVDPESTDAVALVRGEADGALVTALAKPPLGTRFLGQLVAVRIETHDDWLLITPRRALQPLSRYTLVLGAGLRAGGGRLGRAIVRGFTTTDLDQAQPIVSLIDPPDGATDVVRNLRQVAFTMSKPVEVQLVGPSDGQSFSLEDLPLLPAGTRFELRGGFGDPPGFSTGDEIRTRPPLLQSLQLETADRCLVARFLSDRTSFAELCVSDRCTSDSFAATHALGASLMDVEEGWTLRVWDESTAPAAVEEGIVDLPPVPIVITEILNEPRGPRLSQQFVEILNVGDDSVELGGLVLKTSSGQDVLPPATLPSGIRAVIVPSGFADDGIDPMPAEGSLVVRLANGKIGGRGIRSGGEPVWIETASGTLLTRWGGWPAELAPGQSLFRQPFSCDLPSSFHPGTPTPGS
jgi:hypothetical protein